MTFNVLKKVASTDFNAAFTPYVRKHLDDAQQQQFLAVFIKMRRQLHKDREPLQWVEYVTILDALIAEFDVRKFLAPHFNAMVEKHPIIGQDIKGRVMRFHALSVQIEKVRNEFVASAHETYRTLGVQIP